MSETAEQARLREHLRELRHAMGGIGKDMEIHLSDVDRKIERLGRLTGKEAKYVVWEIEDDLDTLGRRFHVAVRAIPGAVKGGLEAAGAGISRAGAGVRDGIETAGAKAAEGTRNALARAAGVRRTPMKEWHTPDRE